MDMAQWSLEATLAESPNFFFPPPLCKSLRDSQVIWRMGRQKAPVLEEEVKYRGGEQT